MTTAPVDRTPLTADNAVNRVGGLQVRSTKDLTNMGTNWTFYGQGGAGKTTLPSDLQDSEFGPVLYAAAESGLTVIQNLDVPYVEINRWQDLKDLLAAYKSSKTPEYKSVALDNLSDMLDKCIRFVAPSGIPTQPEWNKISIEFLQMIRDWRDLTRFVDLNVFFLAWDADERDEVGMVKKDINFTPAIRKAFPGIVDTVGHIAVLDRKPDMRMITFAPGPKTIAKFRRAPTANARKIPFEIFYGLDNLPLADILRTLKTDKEWPASKYPLPSN